MLLCPAAYAWMKASGMANFEALYVLGAGVLCYAYIHPQAPSTNIYRRNGVVNNNTPDFTVK